MTIKVRLAAEEWDVVTRAMTAAIYQVDDDEDADFQLEVLYQIVKQLKQAKEKGIEHGTEDSETKGDHL